LSHRLAARLRRFFSRHIPVRATLRRSPGMAENSPQSTAPSASPKVRFFGCKKYGIVRSDVLMLFIKGNPNDSKRRAASSHLPRLKPETASNLKRKSHHCAGYTRQTYDTEHNLLFKDESLLMRIRGDSRPQPRARAHILKISSSCLAASVSSDLGSNTQCDRSRDIRK
jgi:hypothetical protein